MDPQYSFQDLVRCVICITSEATMYCKICHIRLCKDCEKKHLSDFSKMHKVVSLKQYRSLTTLNYPKCRKHSTERCELHCEQCDIPICEQCISSKKHLGHIQAEVLKKNESKKKVLQKELEELEKSIHPKFIEVASNIPVQKADLSKKQCSEITHTISEIKQTIAELKNLLNSNDVCLVSEYKSKIAEFRRLSSKLEVSLPSFRAQEIRTDQLIRKQFGSLSTEEQDYSMPPKEAESSSSDRSLMDDPRVLRTIDPVYGTLSSIACMMNDTEIWICGGDNRLQLFNLHGELMKSIRTNSGNCPQDIALTRSGCLIYTDKRERTVSIVTNTKIQTLIRLQGWKPHGICSTSSGDLLVVMYSDDNEQTKVVRYSGSTEKQSIQYDDKGKSLFSFGSYDNIKNICENRNLDICVSDSDARTVVVVNQAGKLRFTYTGPPSTTKGSFDPVGITTDSQGRILIADYLSDRVHILDQDGQFLRYINSCNIDHPWDLCVDTIDNLFVSMNKGKVKKIQYYI